MSAIASAITLAAYRAASPLMNQSDGAPAAILVAEVYGCLLIAMYAVLRGRVLEVLAVRRTTVRTIAFAVTAIAISYAVTGIVQSTFARTRGRPRSRFSPESVPTTDASRRLVRSSAW